MASHCSECFIKTWEAIYLTVMFVDKEPGVCDRAIKVYGAWIHKETVDKSGLLFWLSRLAYENSWESLVPM
jgi:hypothetical protein